MSEELDKEKAKRLNEVYRHLFFHCGIESKTEFAKRLGVQRSGLSAALNGSKRNLTKNLFIKINSAFPGVFNLDYLLTGEGQLLLSDNNESQTSKDTDMASDNYPVPVIPTWADAFFDIMTQQIKDNEALNRELRQSIAQVNSLRDDLAALIQKLKK